VTERRYLSVDEFAAASGEKPDTIRKRCSRGLLRCRKTGSRWRIWAGELARVRARVQ
jgi:DNA-directed RNA polymerase specialized sigma24 family protein